YSPATGLGSIVDARESNRLKARLREQVEPVLLGPITSHLIGPPVAGIAGLQAFGKDVLELRLQRVHMADAWCAGRHALLGILLKFDKIKIITPIFHRRSLGERGWGADKNRRPWR